MVYLFTNFARSTLAAGITAGATSITVQTGDGAKFPSPTGGDIFAAVLFKKATGENEIVECTARSGDVLTVTRGREGTTAIAFDASDPIELRPTKAFFDGRATVRKIQDNAPRYGAAGGTANAQTLTLAPAVAAYVDGQEFFFKPVANNTASATMAVSGLPPTTIQKFVDGVAVNLDAGDLDSSIVAHMVYLSSTFYLLNPRLGSAALLADGPGDAELPTGLDLKDTVRAYSKQQAPANGVLSITAGAATWDLNDEPTAEVTLDQNLTSLTINNQLADASYLLLVKQDNAGNWGITWPAAVKWPFGIAPTITSAANAVDLFTFYSDGTNLYGSHIADFQ